MIAICRRNRWPQGKQGTRSGSPTYLDTCHDTLPARLSRSRGSLHPARLSIGHDEDLMLRQVKIHPQRMTNLIGPLLSLY